MAQKSYPNTAHNGRELTLAEHEDVVKAFAGAGILGSPAQTPVVYGDSTGLQVKIRADKQALVRGTYWQADTADAILAIDANAGATRYDLIVLRLTKGTTYTVVVAVVTGTSGSPPPAPTQSLDGTGVWEVPLAVVTVVNGATTIAPGDVSYVAPYIGEPMVEVANPAGLAYVGHKPGQLVYQHSPLALRWDDGTNFRVLAEDTGWIGLPADQVATGWAIAGGTTNAIFYRRFNGQTTAQIRMVRTGSTVPRHAVHVIGALPAGFRPFPAGQSCDFVIGHTDNSGARDGRSALVTAGGDGTLTVQASGAIYSGTDVLFGTVNFISA